jgi:outer membrane lipoprotein carrier protein
MKYTPIFYFLWSLTFFNVLWVPEKNVSFALTLSEKRSPLSLDEVVAKVEQRYAGSGFSARFIQKSVLKAMEIIDTASGRIYIKKPGMMRWEYEKPDRQTIITDGSKLWIYRPEDNQVMVGEAPSFFGEGKGASFLSDIKLIKQNFFILPGEKGRNDHYHLKLLPRKKTLDLTGIDLSISGKTFDIVQVITTNEYGDETRITLRDFQFKQDLEDSLFSFEIPPGVDLVQIE